MSKVFLIIGNSGAGKDTVIDEVLRRFPSHYKKLKVPKRVITRKSSDSEKFEFWISHFNSSQTGITSNTVAVRFKKWLKL